MNSLDALDLTIGYRLPRRPSRVVAEHLNLRLKAGELVCLLGPNGAGKSTLMRTLAGMQPPLGGQVLWQGADLDRLNIQERARRLSIVLTEKTDVGILTAHNLVALGRYPYTDWSGRLTAEDEKIIVQALHLTGAEGLTQRYFHELSDGERQRVLIARALAQQTPLMLLDEPTAFLDLPRRVEMLRMLRKLAHTTHKAILLSTHDLDLALRSADRLFLLGMNGQLHSGIPEDLILSGAFEATFHTEGVEFDLQTGSFRMGQAHGGQIGLLGSGVPAIWTRRALERLGFAVIEGEDQAMGVRILETAAGWRWQWTHTGSLCEYSSLETLIQALKP